MSVENKPIDFFAFLDGFDCMEGYAYKDPCMNKNPNEYHVIEYKAFEQLQKENELLKRKLDKCRHQRNDLIIDWFENKGALYNDRMKVRLDKELEDMK